MSLELEGADADAYAGSPHAPTLVLSGARDLGAPPAMGGAIAARISGALHHLIDDASHLSGLETPDEFAAIVAAFLDVAG